MSLAKASHMAVHIFKQAGKCSPTECPEERESWRVCGHRHGYYRGDDRRLHLCPLPTSPIMYIKAFGERYASYHCESVPSPSSWTKIPILRVVKSFGKAKTALTLLTFSPGTHFSSFKSPRLFYLRTCVGASHFS